MQVLVLEHSGIFSKFHISLLSCWAHYPLVEKTALPICIRCNRKDEASLSACTDWGGYRNSLKELSQNSHWTINIFLEVAFQFQNVLKQHVVCVDDWMFVSWITVDRQKVMPPVLFSFLFYGTNILLYANFDKTSVYVSECIVSSQVSLHACCQPSSSFEQEYEFPPRSCSSSSATTVTCCTSSLT